MTLIPITERTQYCFVDCGKEICECKPTNRIEVDKEKTAIQILIDEMESEFKHATTWSVKKEIFTRGLQKPNPFSKKNKNRLKRLLI